jgi:hypothetical protein
MSPIAPSKVFRWMACWVGENRYTPLSCLCYLCALCVFL